VSLELSKNHSCITPDRHLGSCVKVSFCKPMLDLLDTVSQPFTESIRARLKAYQCGFSRKAATICCPATPIVLDDLEVPSRLPDVSNHRNINLLPKNCGQLEPVDKLVNDNKTGLFEFPWMALLSYQTGGLRVCRNLVVDVLVGRSGAAVRVRRHHHQRQARFDGGSLHHPHSPHTVSTLDLVSSCEACLGQCRSASRRTRHPHHHRLRGGGRRRSLCPTFSRFDDREGDVPPRVRPDVAHQRHRGHQSLPH
jgi:hypothetical protein